MEIAKINDSSRKVSVPESYFYQTQTFTQAGHKQNRLDHVCTLDIDEKPKFVRHTNIICTIGKSNSSDEILSELIENGMNVARFNLSVESYQFNTSIIKKIRALEKMFEHKRHIAIAVDITSPVVRTGMVDLNDEMATLELIEGGTINLSVSKADYNVCNSETIWMDNSFFPNIIHALKIGDRVFLDQGLCSLIVRDKLGDRVRCLIEQGGLLPSNVRVHIPRSSVYRYAVVEKYRQSLLFALEVDADFLYLSFVERGSDVMRIRKMFNNTFNLKIIVRIETKSAIDNIDSILEEADGIIICRGDLAMEMEPEKVFLVQKSLISRCLLKKKPVTIAGQLIESMRFKPRPTRAEVSDVANAVLDGADSLLIGVETSRGKFPVQVVKTVHSICREAEGAIYHDELFLELKRLHPISAQLDSTSITAIAAVEASYRCNAAAIIVITTTGRSAHVISSFRPICPILAIIRRPVIVRQCHLYKGIHPILYEGDKKDDWSEDMDLRINFGIEFGLSRGFLSVGNQIVVVTGWIAGSGSTNTVRVFTVKESDGSPLKVVGLENPTDYDD